MTPVLDNRFHLLIVAKKQKTQRKRKLIQASRKKGKMFLTFFGALHFSILISLDINVSRGIYVTILLSLHVNF